jgi:uncharacterized protein (TIGR03435 family)
MIRQAVVLAFVGGVVAVSAQDAAVTPRFEVASVKLDTSGEGPANNWQRSPGRIDYQNTQLIQLIRVAWGGTQLRVEGGPDWIRTDRYDVIVRFPTDTQGATGAMMLRQFLTERFKLAARLEMRDTPTYSLVMARADRRLGAGLQPGVADCGPNGPEPPSLCDDKISSDGGIVQVAYYDMPRFVRLLSLLPAVARPVVDNTGLVGGYKIDLTFAPPPAPRAVDDPTSAGSDRPSIFTALQEQLGLKLEPSRGLIEVLVIDSVERPTPD